MATITTYSERLAPVMLIVEAREFIKHVPVVASSLPTRHAKLKTLAAQPPPRCIIVSTPDVEGWHCMGRGGRRAKQTQP